MYVKTCLTCCLWTGKKVNSNFLHQNLLTYIVETIEFPPDSIDGFWKFKKSLRVTIRPNTPCSVNGVESI